jgi:adenylate cyclase class IV
MLEIEVKSLISQPEEAQALLDKLPKIYPQTAHKKSESQINHYFDQNGNLLVLFFKIQHLLNRQQQAEFQNLALMNCEYSLRSRQINNNELILVLKMQTSKKDDATRDTNLDSHNAVARREFEAELPLTIEDLDNMILSSGFSYLSKWSRQRAIFELEEGLTLCLDKNAGYGYVVELERVVKEVKNKGDKEGKEDQSEQELIQTVTAQLHTALDKLGLKELDSKKLAKMFDFYNRNWQDYYGTDKVFVLEEV